METTEEKSNSQAKKGSLAYKNKLSYIKKYQKEHYVLFEILVDKEKNKDLYDALVANKGNRPEFLNECVKKASLH